MADTTGEAQPVAAVYGTAARVGATGPGDVPAGPVGLPVAVSSLVVRGRERAEVADFVAHTRLVTLTGSGGAGRPGTASVLARGSRCLVC